MFPHLYTLHIQGRVISLQYMIKQLHTYIYISPTLII